MSSWLEAAGVMVVLIALVRWVERRRAVRVVPSSNTGGVPRGFTPSFLGLEHLAPMMEQLSAAELVATLGRDRALCDLVMGQSDKRYQPSTFIQEVDGTFRVGWYHDGCQAVRTFARRDMALADYLLFSFGKGRL
jgi:hypothetical protein